MVAFYKMKNGTIDIIPPFPEKFMLFIGVAVKQVANCYYLFGFKKLYLVQQALQVFPVNVLRNSNARFPEMTSFAKMEV
jgi:hypothetical protein